MRRLCCIVVLLIIVGCSDRQNKKVQDTEHLPKVGMVKELIISADGNGPIMMS